MVEADYSDEFLPYNMLTAGHKDRRQNYFQNQYQFWLREYEKYSAMVPDEKKADHQGPPDAAHKSVHDTIEHLINGRVTDQQARQQLGKALSDANATPAPAKDSSGRYQNMPGRALKFGR